MDGYSETNIDVKKAYAFSKWLLPPTMTLPTNLTEIINDAEISPLLCFVNRDSGGRRGKALLDSLHSLPLNSLQICDLKDCSPGTRLKLFKDIANRVNVLCCGGDGTINWVLDELSSLNISVGSFGIIPLGTGNDLYLQTFFRILQEQQRQIAAAASGTATPSSPTTYSYAVSPEQVVKNPSNVLAHHAWNLQQSSEKTNQITLDRWQAHIRAIPRALYAQQQQIKEENVASGNELNNGIFRTIVSVLTKWLNLKRFLKVLTLPIGAQKERAKVFSNYIGFGVDGAVSLSFSHLRSAAPFLFFSSVLNKLWYGLCGLYQIILGRHRRDLSNVMSITCDGRNVTIPAGIRGIVCININSYAGGTKLWRADEPFQRGFGARLGSWGKSSMSDGILEVMGVFGIRHLGLIKSGLASAVPICQGRNISFNCTIQTPMQIDGEPFMQKPCVVDLSLFERVNITVPLLQTTIREEE